MRKYLDSITSPDDLKYLSNSALESLADEVREFLINSISKTGGHLASNLGVVELTIALHKVFDSPKDKIIWDVGHQSYTHKILTGRMDAFDTLRQEDGLSGFPKTTESEHDAFISGHSSNSASAGHGVAKALKLLNDNHHVICVVGDGSYTGGMIYEAMNNIGRSGENLIIILNHNDMSISKNVGAIAKYFSSMRSTERYQEFKKHLKKTLNKAPKLGPHMIKSLGTSKDKVKRWLLNDTFFEELGFEYLGPIDGHNLDSLTDVLHAAKELERPVVVHIDTTKGKGYTFAEENPGAYHGIQKFDIETGNPDISAEDSYSGVFGEYLTELGGRDRKICAITAAMKYGTGLQHFYFEHKDRFFDVGIAEQHATTFSAGLASQGMKPVFAVYSSFLQRSYDQILHDCAIEKQHVVLAIDRAGFVGEDGETHQGLFDVNFLTTIPNVSIYSPESYDELKISMHRALYDENSVVAVRYPRGAYVKNHDIISTEKVDYIYNKKSCKTLVITYGRLTANVAKAVENLGDISVLKLIKIYPINDDIIDIAKKYDKIYFYEEAMKNGSIAEHLLIKLYESGYKGEYKITAVNQEFVKQSSVASAFKRHGMDALSIKNDLLCGDDDGR